MLKHIRLQRGLDIPIKGKAEPRVEKNINPDIIAVKPTDFKGVTPKLMVKEGDSVKAGSVLFVDKYRPEICFTSPCSGTVREIVRGEKRKLLQILVNADKENDYLQFQLPNIAKASKEEITKVLLESGLWASILQRPYGIIANPQESPRSIFISAFDSSPLAPDFNFALKDEVDNMQLAVNALAKLTKGGIHIGLDSSSYVESPLYKLKNVQYTAFDGPHPAGNVGVHIHHVAPISKGEIVWTIDAYSLAAVGKLLSKGIYDVSRLIAVTGNRADIKAYVKSYPGMPLKEIEFMSGKAEIDLYDQPCGIRYISGNVLCGENVGLNGYLGFYDHQVTLITEGDYYELLGWAKILRPKKFSFSKTYFSWLTPGKKYNADSNINGGQRAFVVTGVYEKVVPMDIYPVYLLKAILAQDIDKMEQLGIYEVIPEDFALCEYVCPSKIDVQDIVAKGIDTMIKEMA